MIKWVMETKTIWKRTGFRRAKEIENEKLGLKSSRRLIYQFLNFGKDTRILQAEERVPSAKLRRKRNNKHWVYLSRFIGQVQKNTVTVVLLIFRTMPASLIYFSSQILE
jgi:hypothetical protein